MNTSFLKKKPIGRTAHGITDYGFAAVTALFPMLSGMSTRTRNTALGLAAALLGYSLTTDYKPAPIRKIPFKTHRALDIGNLAALLAVPAVVGVMKERKARRFFGALVALGVVNVLLTDWAAEA